MWKMKLNMVYGDAMHQSVSWGLSGSNLYTFMGLNVVTLGEVN